MVTASFVAGGGQGRKEGLRKSGREDLDVV